jgi:hypothetical protein
VKKFLRITYYTGITFVFILVALVGYTQTHGFRSTLLGYIHSHYHSVLNGTLNIGRLEGNLITGIRLYDVSLRNADTSLFTADRIELTHDPLALFFKRVSLGRVSIVNPHIRVIRSARGEWNLTGLFVSSQDTAASSWVVSIKNLELVNARVQMLDSVLIDERARGVRDVPPPGVVDYARVTLDSLNIEAGLRIVPSETDLQLRMMSFTVENPRIHLRHFGGDFKLAQTEASISNMSLETDRSRLKLEAKLSKTDITGINDVAELKTKPVNLDLDAETIDTRELKQFLYPWVDFLDRNVTLRVQVNGEFGRLNVRKVEVETPQSSINLAGTVSYLDHPKNLELDLFSNSSVVDPDDISAHVPGLSLPSMGTLGRTRFRLTFKGPPTDFAATLHAETDAGSVDLRGQLKISDVLMYKTEFETGDLDLGTLFGDDQLNSRLNTAGTVSGIGTNVHTASTVARVEVDSSEFWGMPIGKSAFVFDLNSGVLRSHVQLNARTTTIELSSVLNLPQQDSVSYTLNGSVNALNLADIIRSEQFASDLSFMVRATGRGTSISRLNNSGTISFLRSAYGDVPFETGDLETVLNFANKQRAFFSMRSEPVDLDVEGDFTLPTLIENIINGEQIVSGAIAHRFETLDSLPGSPSFQGIRTPGVLLQHRRPKYVDVSYRLQAKNLYPVGVFFRENLSGSLSMDGTMKGTLDSLDFGGRARVGSFAYRSRNDLYTFGAGSLSVDLNNISRTGMLGALDARVDARTDRFSVNDLAFYNTSLGFASRQDSGSYQWSALVDSVYQVDVEGGSVFASNVYTFELSQLHVGMDFYILENNDPVVLRLGRGVVYVDDLAVSHEVEELGIGGHYSPGGTSDLRVTVKDFLLNNLNSILGKTKLAGPVQELNGILNGTVVLKGSTSDPDLMLDLTTNGFRSRNTVFGQVVARSSYTNHLLSLFVELRNRQNEQEAKPDLLISGTVPYVPGAADDVNRAPKGQINLTMYSKGLNLDFLDPFLPAVSNLSGTLICDMKIRGTVDAPAYEGSITIQGARFLFDPLGINFLVNGKLIPNGNRVGLDNFVIRNVAEDRSDGEMKLAGSFSLAALTLEDFDFAADGQLLVMKESSRLAGQKFYGDLVLATGTDGVHWQGKLSDSKVSGDVLIKSGKITFPPDREAVAEASRTINVIFKDDTSKAAPITVSKAQAAETIPMLSSQYASLGPVTDLAHAPVAQATTTPDVPPTETEQKSFLDNITYDLNIDVQSPTSMRFVFNTQPSEELYADLKGKLAFFKSAAQTRLTGEVTLEGRSFYYFLKRFDASGKVDFTGDPVNPELDVTAKYEGIHTLDTLSVNGIDAPKNVNGQRLTSERVDVLLQITGTKNKPKTKFSLEFPDRDKNSQYVSKDPDADAMSFLLTGYLKDELDPQQRGSFLTVNMLSSLTAGLITGPLTNALKKQISAIQSVDLQYYGGDWNKTDVRVTAEISSAVIRFGGRVIEGINNTNVSVEIPVGSVFGSDRWRNLLFKYERKVDAVESVDQRTQSNSLSLFYRIIF